MGRIAQPHNQNAVPLAFQPEPVEVLTAHLSHARYGSVTVIARTWDPDEMKLCRLCPREQCCAEPGTSMCQVTVPGKISGQAAILARLTPLGD